MTMTDNLSNRNERTITAFFKDRAHAEKAKTDVIQAGIPSAMVTVVEGQSGTTAATTTTSTHEGLWASLKDMFLPDEDRAAYAEGLRRGGYLLSARVSEAQYDKVLTILDSDGAQDMDQAETQWRSEGWKGHEGSALGAMSASGAATTGSTTTSTAAYGGAATNSGVATGTTPVAGASPVGARSATSAQGAGALGEETIQIAEEKLRVGKRDVNHGRVRLRSYVVETPVNESVNLHSESVQVSRRPVDRALNAGEALFQDRTIEAEEHEEVAVVSKEARVVEEISLSKTAQDRTQEINEKVRRTEVEVDDGRGKTGATTGTASGTRRFAMADAPSLIVEHMDVIGSDGTKVGTVDHLEGSDQIKLTKNASPDGQHHLIPLSWVDHVDQHVHLSKTVTEVRTGWN